MGRPELGYACPVLEWPGCQKDRQGGGFWFEMNLGVKFSGCLCAYLHP